MKKVEAKIETPEVLLISPPDDFARYPYLGICQLAAVLRDRGINVSILDCAALKLDLPGIIKHIIAVKPKIIGISIMSMMLRFCYNLIKELQASYPEGLIVVGGAHIDADYAIIKELNVRFAFWGEVEYSFADFCSRTLAGDNVTDVPGLIINEDNKLQVNAPPILDDLSKLPMPAYDLLPIGRYYTPSSDLTTMSYITSRGCPYNCSYCSKLQQKKYRYIDAEQIIDHLAYLNKKFNVRWIEFVDEIFTLHKDRVLELCEHMQRRNLKIDWGIGTRVDRLDEELIVSMKAAGLKKISFGIETGVESIRYSLNKKIDNESIVKTVDLCSKHNLITMGSFILGLPGETEEEIKSTIRFASKLPLNYAYFHRLIPIHNSEIFAKLVSTGQIPADIWTQFMLGRTAHPLYKPDNISEAELRKLYRQAWYATYFEPQRAWRNRGALFSPNHLFKSMKALFKLATPKRYEK